MLNDLIDLTAYPIDARGSARYDAVVDRARTDLRSVGCAVIRGFVNPSATTALSDEIVARKHTTHYSTQLMNPYFHTTPDSAFPDHHPVNTFIERSSGFIPGDSWDPSGVMAGLFRSDAVTAFVRDCLEVAQLYCYADPLAGLTANILEPGQQFTWHFDTNDFAVTVLVDKAEAGGAFQYVPAIRSGTAEGFDAIQRVLDSGPDAGARPEVHTLDLKPGDLQIFRGRYSLHRVERVPRGSTPRHAAIFAYTEQPGVIGRLERTQQLFGRVLQAHIDAEDQRVRSDALLD